MKNKIKYEIYKLLDETLSNSNKKITQKIKDDIKLKQILLDLDDISTLLSNKFTELRKNEKLIITVNYKEDEYNKIQSKNIQDSIISIQMTIKNLLDLYKYMTKYITKYGFIDINTKKQEK